ncbi:MAG TPA: hypothetical protein VF204_10210 [Streptosporangiaceae bacterium]
MLGTQGALDLHVDLLEKPFSESALLCRVAARSAMRRTGPAVYPADPASAG